MSARLITLAALLVAPLVCAKAADAVLSKAYPDVKWVKAATIRVDLIGNGSAGVFAMGIDPPAMSSWLFDPARTIEPGNWISRAALWTAVRRCLTRNAYR